MTKNQFFRVRIADYIGRMFPWRSRHAILRPSYWVGGWGGLTCLPFGELVFQNVVEMLTDLNNDVTFTLVSDRGRLTFAEFVRFFNEEGEAALWRVYRYGYAVVGVKWSSEADSRYVMGMRLLNPGEWHEVTDYGKTYITPNDGSLTAYVMKSTTFIVKGVSDWELCRPAIEFLDNTMNASNTSVKKMGAFVVASPETPSGAPSKVVLHDDDKKAMEDEISKEYGLLNRQRQIMLLPQGMKFETINLTGIDTKLTERVKLNVELIADRLKVPASQIAVIDATAGKSLSNGGEIHEGDRLKYKTYERTLNKTFVLLAKWLGIEVSYTIYNKPVDSVTGTTTTIG